MSEKRKTLYLVDGSAIFYRAYFAFIRNPLINSKGENTSATFGFVNSLLKIIDDEKPDYLAIVFDTREPTFRHKMYDEYKSTRAKMPEDLVEQLPRIREATVALNIPTYELAGYEADDIIGAFAQRAAGEGFEVWCVTGDKDYFQLVNDHVGVYYPGSASKQPVKMLREEVREKFGVYPELVIDKLALMGDSSDNIPGVPGIGPKTADKLLDQFGSVDAVLERWEEIKAKGVREKVGANIEQAKLSRTLVTIALDVPLEFKAEEMKRGAINAEQARELFVELEFTGLVKTLLGGLPASEGEDAPSAPAAPQAEAEYGMVGSMRELKALLKKLNKAKEVAVDTETTSIAALDAELVGVSLCAEAGKAWYVPLGHSLDDEHNLPFDEALAEIKKLLENPKVQKFGQNIKYDLQVFHRYGVDIEPVSFDTMLASFVLDSTARGHSLDALAERRFGYKMQPISDLIGSGKGQKTFDIVPAHKATFYAAEDADYTYRLRGVMAPEIHDGGYDKLYYDIETPLIKVLSAMEEEGIRVDCDFLADLSADMQKKQDELRVEIFKGAGGEFNINSTQQLGRILFDHLKLPHKKKTAKGGGYSTDVTVLESLAEMHPFPRLILDFRQMNKLRSTYIDAIPKLVRPETGRVHTSFNQAVATTGRLSSTNPNLQNIPVRTDDGREIRKAFVPRDEDHVLVVADYSQVELRILAHYSDDPGLIEAFRNEEDIHTRTAAEVYGVALADVTPDQRRAAKTANFAVVYGVSAYGLSQQTELDLGGAKDFIDTYFERYPGIGKYMDDTKEFARENGYVTTMYDRRRYLPEIKSKNFNARQFAERIAINTPIQGSAADIIKIAMLKIHAKLAGMRSVMVLQVHDELVLDAHRDELDKVKKIVKTGMEKAVKLAVPLSVDMGVGDNWLDAK